jgi:hypothetical protein
MPVKIVLVLLLLALPVIPTFWALVDIPRRRFPSPRKKMLWFFTVSTLPFLGAVLYILFMRRHTEPVTTP